MKADEINKLLENVATPIYQIEAELGMPKTTLNQVLKGRRELPKKWAIELRKKYQPETIQEIKEEILPKKIEAKLENIEFDFGDDKWLIIEKYTKYPKKDMPTVTHEKITWTKEKAEYDQRIKIAWNKFQKLKQSLSE